MRYDQATEAERWVDRHGDCLYRYALLRLGTPELAADVVQETFLEALRAQGSFAGRSSERTWLIGILRHKILDHFRKSGREPARFDGESLEREAAFEPGFQPGGIARGTQSAYSRAQVPSAITASSPEFSASISGLFSLATA